MSADSSVDMLARLVAFPTVSRDSNLPLIDWVEEYLEPFGAHCRRTWNAERDKANLFAAIGPDVPGGVV
ncbi:MAG: acetylornithine deacetylase, partial [Pseudomonadota bacterium]